MRYTRDTKFSPGEKNTRVRVFTERVSCARLLENKTVKLKIRMNKDLMIYLFNNSYLANEGTASASKSKVELFVSCNFSIPLTVVGSTFRRTLLL